MKLIEAAKVKAALRVLPVYEPLPDQLVYRNPHTGNLITAAEKDQDVATRSGMPSAWTVAWWAWLGWFLLWELPGAVTKTLGATFSEHMWRRWFPRLEGYGRLLRLFPAALGFEVFVVHLWDEGAHWWSGGGTVAVLAIPVALIIGYREVVVYRSPQAVGAWALEGSGMKSKIALVLVRWFAGGILREIAEGKKGPKAKAIYWRLAGWKTDSGFILACAFGALWTFEPALAQQIWPAALSMIGILISAGLLDKNWRAEAPPVAWAQAFSSLMSWGPALSAAAALGVEVLARLHCSWCPVASSKLEVFAAGCAAGTAWLSARFAEPPDRMVGVEAQVPAELTLTTGAGSTAQALPLPPTTDQKPQG